MCIRREEVKYLNTTVCIWEGKVKEDMREGEEGRYRGGEGAGRRKNAEAGALTTRAPHLGCGKLNKFVNFC